MQELGMAKRERIVLFTGAGASRACGYPTNEEILPEIERRLIEDDFDDEHIEKHAGELKRVLAALLPPRSATVRRPQLGMLRATLEKHCSNSKLDAGLRSLLEALRPFIPPDKTRVPRPQITELLSLIDYCIENGEELLPARRKSLKLTEVRWLLDRAVSRVIKCIHRKGRVVVPQDIMNWIKRERRRGADVTVISTNYDFSLDGYLFWELDDWDTDYSKIDLGFTWRDPDNGELVHPAARPKLRLYKLHGALNWLSCARCGNTYVNFARTVVTLSDGFGDWSTCHCGFRPLRAVLVAPSFVRRYRDRNILSIWRSAQEALRLATRWVVVGYSFPAEDVALRSLFLRAMLARKRAPKIEVVNLGGDALVRYRQLFPDCHFTSDGLRAFLDGECNWNRPRARK
jgi:NAD-dependent SIR2 family protein deacetylase